MGGLAAVAGLFADSGVAIGQLALGDEMAEKAAKKAQFFDFSRRAYDDILVRYELLSNIRREVEKSKESVSEIRRKLLAVLAGSKENKEQRKQRTAREPNDPADYSNR